MSTTTRTLKVIFGLCLIFFGFTLMYYICQMNKVQDIPDGLPFITFMSMIMLFMGGAHIILTAFEDLLNKKDKQEN